MVKNFSVMEVFVKLLSSDDVKTVAVVLEAIRHILKHGDNNFIVNGENLLLNELEMYGG